MEPARTLNTGALMPPIGFGTWKLAAGEECETAVKAAIAAGYRLIDTAKFYGNEQSVGRAVKESGVPREEIFVTTKLWPTDFFDPRKAFEKSLRELGLDYLDLYLIHWPVPAIPKGVWQALEQLADEKLARAIGVSNYGIGDIERLLGYARIAPAVNQIKFSPFDFAEESLARCKEHGILVEAYSPLTRGASLGDETIQNIAQKHGKTPAQVMLRWCVQHGTVPLPKASHSEHMHENLQVFDFTLGEDDMRALDQLS